MTTLTTLTLPTESAGPTGVVHPAYLAVTRPEPLPVDTQVLDLGPLRPLRPLEPRTPSVREVVALALTLEVLVCVLLAAFFLGAPNPERPPAPDGDTTVQTTEPVAPLGTAPTGAPLTYVLELDP